MATISYSSSFVKFLRDNVDNCKVASVLYRLRNKRYNTLLLTTSEVNYLTFRRDGTISFLPEGKELKYNSSGDWSMEGRQNGKPSKVIRKIFTARALKFFKDSDFECFTNAYKAEFNEDGFKFELLKNREIPNVYEMERCSGDGSLNNSCMNGDSEYLDIYKHCDSLQILVLKNANDKLCGRALVWKISDSITFIDRFYVAEDFMYEKFVNYAKENEFWYKYSYKSYDNKDNFITPSGENVYKTFKIVTNTDFDRYPYIDTFQYGGDGYLTNKDSGCIYTYGNTGGTRDGEEDENEGQIYDEVNERYIDEEDARYITAGERRFRNRNCHYEDVVYVDGDYYHEDDDNICKVNGTHYRTDSDEITFIDGDYHLTEDCVYCERDNTSYLQEDCVYCEIDEEDVLRSEAVKINGNWYHEDSDSIVKIDGDYYEIDSDEIEEKDGVYVLVNTDEDVNEAA